MGPHVHHDDHAADGPEHAHSHGTEGWWRRLGHLVRPHSHDPSDSVDRDLEASAEGIRAVKVSLLALLVTAVAQAVIVVVTGSVALLADTIHNFSDAFTALPLWVAFVLGRRRPTRRYTYGYGRAEDLAGVFIVVMIALSAVLAAYESVRRLADPQPLTHPWVVMMAGLIGFAGNELVAEYRIRVGRRIGSAALAADGQHARTDGFTSLAVVLGAIGVTAGWEQADPVVGLLITAAILLVLRGAARDIYRRLMDAVDPDLVATVEAVVAAAPGVVGVEPVRLRWVGHLVRAEVSITADPGIGLVEAHEIANGVHHDLLHAIPRLEEVTVHVSPHDLPGQDFHATLAHHR
jgi:cation diffusion facilitator family transporter